jgi:hypothetical protein
MRILAAAAFTLLAGLARGQSYGPDDQVLTIGVAEFRGLRPNIHADGYLYNAAVDSDTYRATVRLPRGALIERLCLYTRTSPGQTVSAKLVASKLVLGGGGGPAELVIPGSAVQSASVDGYGLFCTDPFAYTVTGTIDVDGDGGQDSVQFSVEVDLPTNFGFGAVRITWKRQVSPPPATATFGDVPLDSPYAQFIEALKASDITGGCQQAPLLYCPDRPITRAEMAVFLAKGLGLHWSE